MRLGATSASYFKVATPGFQQGLGAKRTISMVDSRNDDYDYASDRDAEGETDDEYKDSNEGFSSGVIEANNAELTMVVSTAHSKSNATTEKSKVPVDQHEPKYGDTVSPPLSSAQLPASQRPRGRNLIANLDNAWSHLTWSSKSNKENMLRLLEDAGEDVAHLKANSHADEIIDFIRARRERQVAAGLLPPMKVRLSKGKGRALGPAPKIKPAKKRIRTNTDLEKLRTEKASINRVDIATVRTHLRAIVQQAYNDAKVNAAPLDMYTRKTILHDQSDCLPFSIDIQIMIRDLLRYRETIVAWRAQRAFVEQRSVQSEEAERMHRKLGTRLIAAVQGKIGGGLQEVADAAKLVNDIFSITSENTHASIQHK